MGRRALPANEKRVLQSVRIRPDLLAGVEREAEAQGVKPARIIEDALAEYLASREGNTARKAKRKSGQA